QRGTGIRVEGAATGVKGDVAAIVDIPRGIQRAAVEAQFRGRITQRAVGAHADPATVDGTPAHAGVVPFDGEGAVAGLGQQAAPVDIARQGQVLAFAGVDRAAATGHADDLVERRGGARLQGAAIENDRLAGVQRGFVDHVARFYTRNAG